MKEFAGVGLRSRCELRNPLLFLDAINSFFALSFSLSLMSGWVNPINRNPTARRIAIISIRKFSMNGSFLRLVSGLEVEESSEESMVRDVELIVTALLFADIYRRVYESIEAFSDVDDDDMRIIDGMHRDS